MLTKFVMPEDWVAFIIATEEGGVTRSRLVAPGDWECAMLRIATGEVGGATK
jgi:hypothetical protein